ncbi:type IV pilus twitching motility protein PilT [Candidatus Poribacteria bacterium]|nr:type IV pilus twitching motility protein PilT [Candidatus Poribacteria bacterium]
MIPETLKTDARADMKNLFDLVMVRKASDLLLTAGAPPLLRINGELKATEYPEMTPDENKRLVYSILTDKQREKFEETRELDMSIGVTGGHRFRVNVYMQKGCVTAALRAIAEQIPTLEELGLPKIIAKLAFRPQGLILVTGPTGHGKTTTQAAMLDLINSHKRCHIITVEDPIEYVHHHKKSVIDQREIGSDTLSFPAALKYVLRQDPDVILIGEMRDLETISSALTAAETGHLVIATLHTNDAIQTVDRIVDVFPSSQQQQIRMQLALSMLAVVSQRLLPRANGKGRVLAAEILRNNSAVGNLVREAKTHQIYSIMETHSKDGMITLDSSIKQLYLRGIISYDVAVNHVRNPQSIANA